ncbi:MAG: HAD-IC family P-type ATPase, partial [Candidatus Woesebacteria bacterium]|nr:HAD-IC family P-type ATPase [Candidatus Woesebacteria bacterium]
MESQKQKISNGANSAWHSKTLSETFQEMCSSEHGLTKEEAEYRLKEYGFNKLPEGKVDGLLLIFFRQFQSPLIYILFAAAGIIFAMGSAIDALIIFTVLFFNAIVGAIQEGKAQNTLLALKKFAETSATVLRDGIELTVPDTEIIPGDIIVLQEGEKIPADARIIFANTLKVDEASLTGESEPVTKINTVVPADNLSVADQKNMVFKGTHILSGNGTAVVVATGLTTEIGKIAQKIYSIDTEIPLKTNIRYLSRIIIIAVAIISVSLIILGILSGKALKEIFTTVVALSVSIIPEGLPVVMTLVLAIGVR